MSALVASIGLPELTAGVMVLALNGYALLGGADFGGGIWDLLATGPRREAQRTLITDAIAPIWEANHVWLIIVVVMLFTAFPTAFGIIGVVLHIPLALALVGIVLRGSAFVFRSYGGGALAGSRTWGLGFAGASTLTPFLLGVVIGALSTGAVGAAAQRVSSAGTAGSFAEVFVSPWWSPFPMMVGCFALALFAFLAAVYLTAEAERPGREKASALYEDFRRRALAAALAVAVLAALVLWFSRSFAPAMTVGLLGAPWSALLHVLTGISATAAIAALWSRRARLARMAAAAQVSFILWGWALAQYPFIVPPSLAIRAAAAPAITLRLLLATVAVGAAVLIPSLYYLFRTFGKTGDVAGAARGAASEADASGGQLR